LKNIDFKCTKVLIKPRLLMLLDIQMKYRLIIVVLFFSLGFSSCKDKDSLPVLGDIYVFQKSNEKYSAYKVVKLNKNTVWYIANDYEVSERQYIDSIFLKEQYTNDSIKISKIDFNKRVASYERKSLIQ